MSDTPLTTIGDEPVEARIVAWVLGEASAFEVAELERLCEQRPELRLFHRRMLALHGLLAEAESPGDHGLWKLPPGKRAAIDSIDGGSNPATESRVEVGIRRSGRRALLAIAACLMITFVVMRLLPSKQESQAIIEIKPLATATSPLGSSMAETSGNAQASPQFFGTEFEKIKSRATLEKVVDNLDLTKRWNTDKENALKVLKDSIKTDNIRGTDLVAIRVRHPNQKDADEIAREVTFAYKDHREQLEKQARDKSFEELAKAVRDQEDKVEERRKVLSTIVRTKGIVYKGSDSSGEAIKRGLDAQDYVDAKREFEADQELLQNMKLKLMGETLSKNIPSAAVVVHEVPGGSEHDSAIAAAATEKSAPEEPGQIASNRERASAVVAQQPKKSEGRGELALAERQPAAPASSMAGAVAASAAPAPARVPVPEVAMNAPAIDFGDGDDFGTGWGGRDLPGNALTDGLRSGDATVSRTDVDAALDAPAQVPAAQAEIPVLGGLFSPSDSKAVAASDGQANGGQGGGFRFNAYDASGKSEPSGQTASLDPAMTGRASGETGPIRTNPALTYEHTRNVDKVRRGLYSAEGNLNLGKMDEAKEEYEKVLRVDPYNKAARRGLERVAAAKTDYYRAAYDHTRSELLAEVDNAWELTVPAEPDAKSEPKVDEYWDTSKILNEGKEKSGTEYHIETGYKSEYLFRGIDLSGKANDESKTTPADKGQTAVNSGTQYPTEYEPPEIATRDSSAPSELARREMVRRKSPLSDTESLRQDARRFHTSGEYQQAYDTYMKALELIPDAPLMQEQRESLKKSLSEVAVALANQAEKGESAGWLNKALEWDPDNQAARDRLLVDVSSEVAAAEEPYSTFSLNVSDASFQIAKAELAKGGQPDPAGIKVEQFYNAVDYGDPAPSGGEPVALAVEQSAHPVIPGRSLVRIAVKTAAEGRAATQPLRLTLLVDQSGSMVREDRRAAMEKALSGLSTLLGKDDLVTVIGFSRTPRLLADGMPGDQADKLAGLVNQTASEGGTNLEQALQLGEQLAERRKLDGAQNRIVLFTDGAANLGDADPVRLAEKIKQLRQKGLSFDIAGIAAEGLNDELLGELARNGNGRYYVVGKGGDDDFAARLAGAFRPAAENVKVQVRFRPERVARYKLIGFEKDRLTTEDFRNDAVDAAEMAAEEAGVAIYQIEPLPGGSGEIGEVSVRFRDSATGAMVERTRAIPHDERVPAIDRAAPSMQLAVLAMLAGEKLKGGPLADAIDFKQLSGPRANVRGFYGPNGRAAEVLQVIEMLK